LIKTNVKQRAAIGGSTTKMSRIINKLEEIYGIKRGGERAKVRNEHLKKLKKILLKKTDFQHQNTKLIVTQPARFVKIIF
jgi:hypothetical protein